MFPRLALVLLLLLPQVAAARTASELQLAIRKLNVVGSALYVAAHPDDENTAMLAWWANEKLVRASYLSLTRGDGGQNLIGDEKGALLGVIRTQELLAARRIDRAEQYFTRAIDFGYTKTPEETLSIWDRNAVLADVVWTIRRLQPDVIVTRFPTTGEGGHGQHTASAILAEEAFRAAGDPSKFPEQLQYVAVWQPKRIYWNRFSWQRIDPNSPEVANDLRVDLGTYNALLGRAYTEIAAESRSQHKSQGFGSAERRGSVINYLKQTGGDPSQKDLFEGIDLTWSRRPGGETMSAILKKAADTFDAANPAKSIPILLDALTELDRLGASDAWSPVSTPWIEVKRAELLDVISGCAGLSIDVSAADSTVTPGGDLTVNVAVVNRSDYPFTLSTVASLYAKPSKAPGVPLKNNEPVRTELAIKLPPEYPLSQPYWLREAHSEGMFRVSDQKLIGRAVNGPSIPITVSLQDPQTRTLIFTVPAVFRRTDPVEGEKVREVSVVPEVTLAMKERVRLFPEAKARDVIVTAQSFVANANGSVRLVAPEGWRVTPESAPIALKAKGDETDLRFTVTPPAGETTAELRAEYQDLSYSLTNLDYPHIPAQRVLAPAAAKLVRIDLKRRGQRIGFIMGSGDEIPDFLRQAGYDVTLLSDTDLDAGNFTRFDTIVTGVRAYNTRTRLRAAHPKLMSWVENGGTMVVQYNTLDDLAVAAPGPYPFKISRDRVSVEAAPIEVLKPQHTLLTTPNKIHASDFDHWVQERGLYFAGEWDPKYETVIASNDPGEKSKPGGELFARHGKGAFVYTSYSWFRQLPAGVPGAYKMFVNLVSAR